MEIRAGGGSLDLEIQAGGGSSGPGNPGGRGSQKNMPSVGGMWIFSGITQCNSKVLITCSLTKLEVTYIIIQ